MKRNLLLLLLCITLAVSAQAQMTITGEVRPRTEVYNGNNTGLANKDERIGVATQQRTRLYFNYEKDGLKLVFSPQLIHFWGQMPQTYDLLGAGAPGGTDPSAFSVFEAYAEYKASDWYTLKVGRQAISYYDQRWFGALGWAAASRAHDAFVSKLTFGKAKIDVGVALNQTKHVNAYDSLVQTTIRTGYKSLQYAWLTMPMGEGKLRAMITNVNPVSALSGSPDYKNITTFAVMPSFKVSDFAINLSAYGQLNESNPGWGYLLAADVTYKGAGLPITLGADVLSGTSTAGDGSNTWLQPFGTNHKFYGFMDFFYVGESDRTGLGLTDIYAKAVVKTGEKTKLIIMPHAFSTTLKPEGIASDGYLGTEIDLVFNYNVAKGFNFKLGYSKMFATSLMEAVAGGDKAAGNQWAWMQLTFKPTLYKSEKE